MLIIRRKESQEVTITHVKSGETIMVRVFDIGMSNCALGFEDAERNFYVDRPDRRPHESALVPNPTPPPALPPVRGYASTYNPDKR